MPTPTPQLPLVRTIDNMRPLVWLVLAWRDMARAGWISFAHGFAMAAMGAAIVAVAYNRFWLLAGALSGFLVIAPVLATSLYALSRAIARNEKADSSVVLKTWLNWQHGDFIKWGDGHWQLLRFGVLLATAGTTWVVAAWGVGPFLGPVLARFGP